MLTRNCWKQSLGIMYIFEYRMYIFKNQMSMFGYFKIPDIILTLASSQKLNWTHSFDTHCTSCLESWNQTPLGSGGRNESYRQ